MGAVFFVDTVYIVESSGADEVLFQRERAVGLRRSKLGLAVNATPGSHCFGVVF